MFRAYLAKPDAAMVDKALQGLASLLIGAPRLMLVAEKDGLVGKVLAHPEAMIRLQGLRCCCEILEAEEHRIESGMARRLQQRPARRRCSARRSGPSGRGRMR